MSNEVEDLLNALHEGSVSIEEVAQRFRERSWPRRQRETAQSYPEMATAAAHDPDPYIAGSYDDLATAYHQGRLSDAQYTVLVNAIVESKKIEDDRK